jgi:threonyl-tRNA synthetase
LTGKNLNQKIEKNNEGKVVLEHTKEELNTLRHSIAHVMAAAVKELFPEAKFAIGPSIEEGFYYDFDLPRTLTPDDLPKIEKKMKRLVSQNLKFEKSELGIDEAISETRKNHQGFKVELLEELKEKGEKSVSFYKTGDFTDLCRGPHIESTSKIKAFKLTKLAGAYWRGDEKRPMLQRVYGTAFFSKQELDLYLERIEEAKKRDHRLLGKQLDLFSFHEEGPGFPFFHPKGMVIINELLSYWRRKHDAAGYHEIKTPILLQRQLWERSGHWENYRDNMYFTKIDEVDMAIKPMNCPGGLLVYKTQTRSYREFPLRTAELGLVHRHEISGVLHGLFRVRSFTQDDAHIYCLPEQIQPEVVGVINLAIKIYEDFGFDNWEVELSTRPEKSIGTDEMWEKAEKSLSGALEEANIEFKLNPGDGAFYGPKIDFHIRDCMDRKWQCATIQLDFAMPERFELEYMGDDNKRHRPVMIHRAILGSIERFLGVLIEHYGGALPGWLAPLQLVIVPIADRHLDYGRKVEELFKKEGLRVEVDDRREQVSYKIRNAQMQKIPFMLVVGDREEAENKVSVRERSGTDLGPKDLAEAIKRIKDFCLPPDSSLT